MSPENIIDASPKMQEVRRLLSSKVFQSSAVHRNLLSYLAEKSMAGEADNLKEYTVGIEALAKPSSYDPRQDSSVRMHTARLRQKLAEYYRTEGVNDPVWIDMPKGGFKVTFVTRKTEPVGTISVTEAILRRHSVQFAMALMTFSAVACAVYFGVRFETMGRSEAAVPVLTSELRQVWQPLLSSDRPLALCLSVPVFVRVSDFNGVVGPFMGNWEAISKSSPLEIMKKSLGAKDATPSYDYTNVATAMAAFRIGQFLATRAHNILLTRSDLVSLPEVAMDNIIYVGSSAGNPQLQTLPPDRQFVLDENGVRNLHPGPGQPPFLPDSGQEEPAGFPETHALITLAPGTNGSGFLLYLMGNNEAAILAAVDTVINPVVAHKVFARLMGPDGQLPRYFQLVVTVKSMEEMPIDISYATHQQLSTSVRATSSAREKRVRP